MIKAFHRKMAISWRRMNSFDSTISRMKLKLRRQIRSVKNQSSKCCLKYRTEKRENPNSYGKNSGFLPENSSLYAKTPIVAGKMFDGG